MLPIYRRLFCCRRLFIFAPQTLGSLPFVSSAMRFVFGFRPRVMVWKKKKEKVHNIITEIQQRRSTWTMNGRCVWDTDSRLTRGRKRSIQGQTYVRTDRNLEKFLFLPSTLIRAGIFLLTEKNIILVISTHRHCSHFRYSRALIPSSKKKRGGERREKQNDWTHKSGRRTNNWR